MLSKGSLTVLPVVTDNVAYNLGMQPASKAASGSSGQTNYLYVSPNLVFNPATNQLVFNSSVVFGGTATYANGSPVGSGTIATATVANTSGASVTISDTVPSSPTVGNLWWNSTLGTLLIYYFNSSSNTYQWVVTTSAGGSGSVGGGSGFSAAKSYTYNLVFGRG